MKKTILLLIALLSLTAMAQPKTKLKNGTELNWQPVSETVTWDKYPFAKGSGESNYAWQVVEFGDYGNGKPVNATEPSEEYANERFGYITAWSALSHVNSPTGNHTYLVTLADGGHTMILNTLVAESENVPYDGWIKMINWAATLDSSGNPDDIYIYTIDNHDIYRVLKLQRLK